MNGMAKCFAEISYYAPNSGLYLCWVKVAYIVAVARSSGVKLNWKKFVKKICEEVKNPDCRDCLNFDCKGDVCRAIEIALSVTCQTIEWTVWFTAIKAELCSGRPVVISNGVHAWVVIGINEPAGEIWVHNPDQSSKNGNSSYRISQFQSYFFGDSLWQVPAGGSGHVPMAVNYTEFWSRAWWIERGLGLDSTSEIENIFKRVAVAKGALELPLRVGEEVTFEVGELVARSVAELSVQGGWEENSRGWRATLGLVGNIVGLVDLMIINEKYEWIAKHDSTLLKDLAAAAFDLRMRKSPAAPEWEVEWLTVKGIACEALRARANGADEWSIYYPLGYWTYGLKAGVAYPKATFEAAMWEAHNALSD